MKRDQALQILADHKDELARRGVKSIAIFGSTARDEAGARSDIDILVDVDHDTKPFGIFAFLGLKDHLEEILGCRVDLVTPDSLHPGMRDGILREAIRAA